MADNISIDSVRKVIEKNIEKELYTAKSESLLSLHNFLSQHTLTDNIVVVCYNTDRSSSKLFYRRRICIYSLWTMYVGKESVVAKWFHSTQCIQNTSYASCRNNFIAIGVCDNWAKFRFRISYIFFLCWSSFKSHCAYFDRFCISLMFNVFAF